MPEPDATRTAAPAPADLATATYKAGSPVADLATLTRGHDAPPPPAAGFRLAAGQQLAGRYRIVAPLGRGGMGEVYRADDLVLGVPVALKFLPEAVATDPVKLGRLRKEVAAARQVSHPHVCRVYDIGEADGHAFLSMEFIPGDDLSGLLHRVGHLAPDVACDLGRQIALGLHAVHDEGMVHRDLKPANVMVDGRGRAKLTDFGLAAAGESVTGLDAFAGTPAYQAPEQLAGATITERTDVYALGAVVYELLTGRRPFVATKRADLVRAQQETKPTRPSELVPDVSADVDRVVLKCLAFDPKDRPASAHEVWRALPGDAALNLALAEGRTPTAEAVADAGGEGRLSRRTALLLAGWTGLMVAAVAVLADWGSELRLTPSRPAAELRAAAQEMLRRYGPADHVADRAGDFVNNFDLYNWRNTHDLGADRLAPLAHGRLTELRYWYRENPVPLVPEPVNRTVSVVTSDAPATGLPGSATVFVDPVGRLLSLERAVPVGRIPAGGEPDWGPLFADAGLDPAAFRVCEPAWNWRVPHDRRAAWVGGYPERPGIELRVEAAADRGEPVGFRLAPPWAQQDEDYAAQFRRQAPTGALVRDFGLPLLALLACTWLAARQVRAGRADLRGAGRFAAAYAAVNAAYALYYVWPAGSGPHDFYQPFGVIARVGLNAVLTATVYVALEPYVRRRWPRVFIGWNRLLAGRAADPRVGREVLLGVAVGATMMTLLNLARSVPGRAGGIPELPLGQYVIDRPLPALLAMLVGSTEAALMLLFLTFLLASALRTRWLYVPAVVGLSVWLNTVDGTVNPAVLYPLAAVSVAVVWVTLTRGGLLAGCVTFATMIVLAYQPITYDPTVWYWKATALALGAVAAMTLYGLVVSVGGWRALARPASEPV